MTFTQSNANEQQLSAPVECDIVMKGGITSGVVYPAAVVALSEKYRFRNIGGTSAGAIAAAVTAAAEYGRQTEGGTAFTGLADVPTWLSAQRHLFGLFRANRRTRPVFTLLTRVLDSPKGQNKLLAVLAAVLFSNWTLSAASAIPGLLIAAYGVAIGYSWLVAVGILLLFFLPFGASLWSLFDCLANKVPANLYGMCTGLDETNPSDTTVLTSWLTNVIDVLAGVEGRKQPLTFGDLWGLGAPAPDASPLPDREQDVYSREKQREAREINLEMITTNVTHGRPYRFPFDTNIFYFDPGEFHKLFPARVVDHMVAKSRQPSGDDPTEPARIKSALPRIPLPEAGDLPIVVAARMSLSFPLLISAVPLHAVDWSLPQNQQNRTAPLFEPCWFSDGGLSSNFPIHLFDGPIPTRPTFAIDLDTFPPFEQEQPDQCKNVWMPNSNIAGTLETWTRFGEAKPDLGGFSAAILNAMQNWQDNTQSRVPGFRDRIVHVYLNANEGGLNLNMSSELLVKLAQRGTCAGQRLIDNFAKPNPTTCAQHAVQPTNWDNHCIVRYRTAMALLENWIRKFCSAYTTGYKTLMDRPLGTPPCGYPWHDDGQRSYATSATDELGDMNTRWIQTGETFAAGAPKPQPQLAVRPRT
jgi:predicted acylesterase/phospholipase RssA